MIVDTFLAFNEIELAEFRIKYLWELTDIVIIGESHLTHSGVEKPLYFREWLNRRQDLQQKVRVVEIELNRSQGHWEREIASREYLQRYLRENFSDRKAILSDLDEIPTTNQVREFLKVNDNVHFKTTTYYRRANFALQDDSNRFWNNGVMISNHYSLPRNGGRYAELPILNTDEVGGHFSYLGMNREQVNLKVRAFAHSEINTAEFAQSNLIDFCDFYAIDHLGRFQFSGMGIFEICKMEMQNELQAKMYQFNSKWFNYRDNTPPHYIRILASAAVTHAIRNLPGSRRSREAIANFTKGHGWIFHCKTGIILQLTRKVSRIVFSRFYLQKVFNRGRNL